MIQLFKVSYEGNIYDRISLVSCGHVIIHDNKNGKDDLIHTEISKCKLLDNTNQKDMNGNFIFNNDVLQEIIDNHVVAEYPVFYHSELKIFCAGTEDNDAYYELHNMKLNNVRIKTDEY